MANLSDCAGEIVIEREIDQYTRDSEVASHCDLTVQWDFNDATQERASFWKKNFGTVLDLHYGRKPSVERILREDGTYGLPYAEIRASLYTPQQWYDLFHKMGWEAELEQEDEVERATIRVP